MRVALVVPVVVMLAQTVPLEKCGKVEVEGEKTLQCPKGRYVVVLDQSVDPPLLSRQCKEPVALPSPTPEPSPTPSPSPEPSPSPSPWPSPTPTPSPSPSATPPPSPSPTPSPATRLPADPVPAKNEERCQDQGLLRAWGHDANGAEVPLCLAPSLCPRDVCYEGEFGLTRELMQDDHCRPFNVGTMEYGFRQGHWSVNEWGYIQNVHPARGQYDAYGRIYAQGSEPRVEIRPNSWNWNGWCPPLAAMQPAAPSPSPTPTPVPSPTPSPSPGPPTGELCPQPNRIKLGFINSVPRPMTGGFKNNWTSTPMVPSTGDGGSCEWKRDQATGRLPSECEAMHQCAEVYGQPEAFQESSAFSGREPLERWGNNPWNFHIATNSEDQWVNGQWIEAGSYTLCVSLPTLPTWRCQQGVIGPDGKASGFGQDHTGFDLAK